MPTLRKHALQIYRAALDAADAQQAVARRLSFDGRTLRCGPKRYNILKFDRILVIGAGKASAAMAVAVERLLERRISGGWINVPYGTLEAKGSKPKRVRVHEARHPLPDDAGMRGAMEITEIARTATERDLVIALISGGASALLPAPVPGLTLQQKQDLTWKLLKAGADIHELNAVRKHLSLIKGGQLASLAYPAKMLTLILSDVIGDDLDVIGSGPTVADRATVADAEAVLAKYGVQLPGGAKQALWRETPKPGDERLSQVENVIVGSNRLAVDAAAAKAKELGYRTLVLSTFIEGETRDVAGMHAAIAKEILAKGRPVRAPACILSGGETTVTVRGKGLGGRNQEFVLAAALALENHAPADGRVTVFSGGTDGADGPTDAAGAVADSGIMAKARELGMDGHRFLDENDSYHFFDPLNGLVKTGPSGTNVMDVRVLLIR